MSWRKNDLQARLEKSRKLRSGEAPIELKPSGEEGVGQMRVILGLCPPLVTNVNLPNCGQIPNLPMGAVVETNAVFRANSLTPVFAGPIPKEIYPLVSRVCGEQELVSEGIAERDVEKIFNVFANDPLVDLPVAEARKLFDEMVEGTREYLKEYFR